MQITLPSPAPKSYYSQCPIGAPIVAVEAFREPPKSYKQNVPYSPNAVEWL